MATVDWDAIDHEIDNAAMQFELGAEPTPLGVAAYDRQRARASVKITLKVSQRRRRFIQERGLWPEYLEWVNNNAETEDE